MKKLFIICFFIIFSFNTYAYVIPGKQIIELMIKSLGTSEGLSASHKFYLFDQNIVFDQSIDNISSPLEFMETIYYKFPEKLYSEIIMNGKQKLHVVSPKGIVTVIEGKISQQPQTSFDHYKDILLYRSEKKILRRLSIMGINFQVSSFGKEDKKAFYIVGAKFPDESVPQLWVDIEDIKPYKWLIYPKTDINEKIEVKYTEWIPISDDAWYPNLIEYYQNNQLLAKIMLDSYDLDPELSEDLFNINYIKEMYEGHSAAMDEESDINEVQKTIRDFRNTFQ